MEKHDQNEPVADEVVASEEPEVIETPQSPEEPDTSEAPNEQEPASPEESDTVVAKEEKEPEVPESPDTTETEIDQTVSTITNEDVAIPSTDSPEAITQNKRSKKKLFVGIVLAVVLLNLGVAGAGAFMYTHPKVQKDDKPATSVATTSPVTEKTTAKTTAASPAAKPVEAKIKHYVSPGTNIEFDYPSDWYITATPDDTNIVLKSPTIAYTDPAGTQTIGQINLRLAKQDGNNTLGSVLNDDDKISENSIKLTYKNPSPNQRKETNLSFATMSNGSTFAVFVSGNLVYKIGETVGSKDRTKIDPVITLYVDACPNQSCQAFSPGSFNAAIWKDAALFQRAQAIIESLRIQK